MVFRCSVSYRSAETKIIHILAGEYISTQLSLSETCGFSKLYALPGIYTLTFNKYSSVKHSEAQTKANPQFTEDDIMITHLYCSTLIEVQAAKVSDNIIDL